MYLEMHIGRMFIDRLKVDFTGLRSVSERQEHLNALRDKLERKHLTKIAAMKRLPVYYIDNVPSKVNKKSPHEFRNLQRKY